MLGDSVIYHCSEKATLHGQLSISIGVFLLCFPCKDEFVRKTRRIYQEISENTMDVDFQFMSEKDMVDEGYDESLIFSL